MKWFSRRPSVEAVVERQRFVRIVEANDREGNPSVAISFDAVALSTIKGGDTVRVRMTVWDGGLATVEATFE